MPAPPCHRLMLLHGLTLLLLCGPAAGAQLRDAGYSDGSLVDASGHYYYLQPDGSYLDVYGATFSPVGDGVYQDGLGNLIDAGQDPDPGAVLNLPKDIDTPGGGAAPDLAGESAQPDAAGPATATDRLESNTRSASTTRNGELDGRYLNDVGDGYLAIEPDDNGDGPSSAPAKTGAGRGFKPTIDPDGALSWPEPEEPPPNRAFGTIDLSAPDRKADTPQRRSGPVHETPRRLRPGD